MTLWGFNFLTQLPDQDQTPPPPPPQPPFPSLALSQSTWTGDENLVCSFVVVLLPAVLGWPPTTTQRLDVRSE